MRAPARRRPRRREIRVPPGTDLARLANKVKYVGSPEHKDFPSFAGQPRPRADASRCPKDIRDVKLVTRWLRSAIRKGVTGAPWEPDEEGFPRYVWYKEQDTVFEGRLINRGDGWYKGYPLDRSEWPPGIEEKYA